MIEKIAIVLTKGAFNIKDTKNLFKKSFLIYNEQKKALVTLKITFFATNLMSEWKTEGHLVIISFLIFWCTEYIIVDIL